MKKSNRKLLVVLGIAAAVGIAGTGFAADDMKAKAATPAAGEKAMTPEEQEMMKKFQEFSTPGENHHVLDPLIGKWDFSIKSWMSADAPPEESTGTSEIAWDLDGHFVKQTVSGSMMGKPFNGMGFIGYDNLKKEYESIWIDNMSTGMMKGSGKWDAAAKALTSSGTFSCPLVGGDRTSREVTTIVDADHFTHEMYSPGADGKEFKMMEIRYTRAK